MSAVRGCRVDECDRPRHAHGLCQSHYRRWKRHGDALAGRPSPGAPLGERLEFYSKRSGDCLIWTGSRTAGGYGHIYVDGKMVYVHRLAWVLENGRPPAGSVIDHKCFNKPCFNTDHLEAVSVSQNGENREGANSNSASGVRGVCWSKAAKKWSVEVWKDRVKHRGGLFDDLGEAEAAAVALRNRLHTVNRLDRALGLAL